MTFDALGAIRQITNYLKTVKGYDEASSVIHAYDSGRIGVTITASDAFSDSGYHVATRFNKWESCEIDRLEIEIDKILQAAIACDSRKVRELKHTQAQLGKLIEDTTEFSAINEELIRTKIEQMREDLGSLLLTYEKKTVASVVDDTPSEDHQHCMHCGEYQDECQCDGGR